MRFTVTAWSTRHVIQVLIDIKDVIRIQATVVHRNDGDILEKGNFRAVVKGSEAVRTRESSHGRVCTFLEAKPVCDRLMSSSVEQSGTTMMVLVFLFFSN